MGLDLQRVGDLWIQDAGPKNEWLVSSAYLVGDSCILTARHGLPKDATQTTALVGQVFFTKLGPDHHRIRRKVTGIAWMREGTDLVMLTLEPHAAHANLAPIVWMSPPRRLRREAETCGFPETTMVQSGPAKRRVSKTFRGLVDPNGGVAPSSENDVPRLIVDISYPVVNDASVLHGLSGAGLVIDAGLVGIVSTAFKGMSSIEIVPTAPLLDDPAFRGTLGLVSEQVLDGDSIQSLTTAARDEARSQRLTSAAAAACAAIAVAVAVETAMVGEVQHPILAILAICAGGLALLAQAVGVRQFRRAERHVVEAHAVDEKDVGRLSAIAPLAFTKLHGQLVPTPLQAAMKTAAQMAHSALTWTAVTGGALVLSLGATVGSSALATSPAPPEVSSAATGVDPVQQRETCRRVCAVIHCDAAACDVTARADPGGRPNAPDIEWEALVALSRKNGTLSVVMERGIADAGAPIDGAVADNQGDPGEERDAGATPRPQPAAATNDSTQDAGSHLPPDHGPQSKWRLVKKKGDNGKIAVGKWDSFVVIVHDAAGLPMPDAHVLFGTPGLGTKQYIGKTDRTGQTSATQLYTSAVPGHFAETAQLVKEPWTGGEWPTGPVPTVGSPVTFEYQQVAVTVNAPVAADIKRTLRQPVCVRNARSQQLATCNYKSIEACKEALSLLDAGGGDCFDASKAALQCFNFAMGDTNARATCFPEGSFCEAERKTTAVNGTVSPCVRFGVGVVFGRDR